MCRVELSAVIAQLMYKWSEWKWQKTVQESASSWTYCPVNRECSWKKTHLFYYLFISSLFKVDLRLAYKKPINVNNNTAYMPVNKLPSNKANNKTKYLIVKQN